MNGTVANLKTTEEDKVFSCLEGSPALRDLVKELVPLVNFLSKLLVDDVFLLINVPKRLIVTPGRDILSCLLESLLELHVDGADIEARSHLVQEALIGLLTLFVANSETLKATDDLDLTVKLLVPVSLRLGKRWLKQDLPILQL